MNHYPLIYRKVDASLSGAYAWTRTNQVLILVKSSKILIVATIFRQMVNA